MNRLSSIFRRDYIPTRVSYKTKSGPIHREALNIYYENICLANEILDPLPESIEINNNLLVGNLTKEDLLLAKLGSSTLNKLNNDDERTLALYLNKVVINDNQSIGVQKTFTDSLVYYLLA
ncbi:6943_t:CDS:1 [Diversispora eburnea]|uniref:6943_t:CDS:1 n=1 Tax=Diversispora eburnea TaxID=1213867 RepID=A0A9N9F7G1_9GLOM|nr:6943_t:CDS:1 [Diversispora eburnea]